MQLRVDQGTLAAVLRCQEWVCGINLGYGFMQMGERQEVAIPDLSGLGLQLGDLDRKLVKDLQAVPDKIVPVKR